MFSWNICLFDTFMHLSPWSLPILPSTIPWRANLEMSVFFYLWMTSHPFLTCLANALRVFMWEDKGLTARHLLECLLVSMVPGDSVRLPFLKLQPQSPPKYRHYLSWRYFLCWDFLFCFLSLWFFLLYRIYYFPFSSPPSHVWAHMRFSCWNISNFVAICSFF